MATGAPMSDEDMRKELENIQLKINATTDEVHHTMCVYLSLSSPFECIWQLFSVLLIIVLQQVYKSEVLPSHRDLQSDLNINVFNSSLDNRVAVQGISNGHSL